MPIGDPLGFIRAERRKAIGRAKSAPGDALELDGLVLQLRDAGLSYAEIGRELETRTGRRVTRQAVHQRVRRLLLAARGERVPRGAT